MLHKGLVIVKQLTFLKAIKSSSKYNFLKVCLKLCYVRQSTI